MDVLSWRVGDARILRFVEVDGSAALDGLIGGLDSELVAATGWLRPNFVDETGRLMGLVQAFVILIAGRSIMVDPGVGDGKRREVVPAWSDLHRRLPERLQAAGIDPRGVDFVINTHLHFDHVGGNTTLGDDGWEATYPAAGYIMSAAEFAYWDSKPQAEIADQHAGFADSVLPVVEAGKAYLVADDHMVTDHVRLVPSPGHTPHHVSVLIESGGRSALLTGDVMHHPCQIAFPAWGAVSDFDPARARASRTELVERYVDTDTLVLGTHFADPVGGHIRSRGTDRYFAPAQ